ncbi:type II secretion system GspH family protein [Aliivibrio sifiae]
MKKLSGFTLIELILTVVVVGIVALAAGNTLQLGFQSYNESIDRQDNQMQAKFLIEKLSRELRHAMPNSVEVSNSQDCVSFIPVEASAFYLTLPLFNEKQIDTVLLSNNTQNMAGLNLTINPSNQNELIENNGARYVAINSVTASGGISAINFSTNNNPAFISNSVSGRAFIYKPEVISYCIDVGKVNRTVKKLPNQVSVTHQLANHINSGKFIFEQASIHRNNMVRMVLAFENDLGEITQYQHDVQVINVP